MDLKTRQRQHERMDDDDVDPKLLKASLSFIRRINQFLGYTRATIGYLERFSQSWERGKTIHLLDLATGSADVPRAILGWADRNGWDVQITGVDRHPTTAQIAAAGPADPRLTIVQADVFDLPFADNSFDYTLTSMFLHHLDDDDIVRVMRTMGRLARRGVIIADLIRDRRAYAWATFFTLFSNSMLKHDARVSVAQAFTGDEIVALRDRAGLRFADYHAHFGHRFVIAGEKQM